MTVAGVVQTLEPLLPATPTAPAGVVDAAALATSVSSIAYDSRRVGPGSVFVALRGLRADGAVFAAEAIARGAVAVVAERPPDRAVPVPWVVVSNARVALASLAAEYHGHPSHQLKVVGITGTNGKTTTTYLLRAVFEAAGVSCGLMGTVAYSVGRREVEATRTTPEAPDVQGLLQQMVTEGCGACAMEVSSHALALHRVDGTRFAAGVFTNLTRDHLDFHQNMESYYAAKRRLFEMLTAGAPAIVNVDDPRGEALAAATHRPITYALDHDADVTPGPITSSLAGLSFDARSPGGVVHVRSRLVGRPNVYNLLATVATAVALGLPRDALEQGIANLDGVPGRFQTVSSATDDVSVLVDYAHTDDALRNLLETARPLAPRRLIAVFGCGGDRDRTKRPLMGMVAARLSDVVVLTSDNPRSEDPRRIIEEVLRGAREERHASGTDVITVVDRREAIHESVRLAEPGDMVLIAGRGHEQTQEIAGERLPFDDVTVAREALANRRSGSRVE